MLSVYVTERRLLSWPDTCRSKQDQPGNITFIKLRLVDLYYRICLTRNVPPQQHEWWAAAARQAANLNSRLPLELASSVMEPANWFPISAVEAGRLREKFHGDHERARKAIDDGLGGITLDKLLIQNLLTIRQKVIRDI
ncbi:hypothetical protein N7476_003863 [Penicillium atrosanguineum]|uniref:DUF4246 domain-containing protein n=1 Tax=Penicillium atrosanguineum TaxID=1132637 RepID=A0A9W9U5H8_9EURO|nr:hypothetical protein N7476_003863 [Penicillium atrosanguineum]